MNNTGFALPVLIKFFKVSIKFNQIDSVKIIFSNKLKLFSLQ